MAISLALQGGLSNFAGGVLILLLKPFKVGDYIVFPNENQEGTVLKIEMYYTTISSVDNRTIMIPNANLTNSTIVNVTAMEKRKLEMAEGGCRNTGTEACIAITGIAGPGGGTPEKPVGLVYMGCCVNGKTIVQEYQFRGSRTKIREQAVVKALTLLRSCILDTE